MKHFISGVLCISLFLIHPVPQAEESTINGKVKIENQNYFAWQAESNRWISLEDFWLAFVDKNNGLTWEASAKYPPYKQVKEFDTFMAITIKGNCLMEFYHTRWRRANDVRRWDDQFNDYAGCPFVFD
ncbi:MAG: hypothetical protein COA86_06970 [Kangiella sp.]|nr:MAG: hypothetical protein COA86_06970 [Kangiella sp.]